MPILPGTIELQLRRLPVESGYIRGLDFDWTKVRFAVADGVAILQSDIILGPVESIREISRYIERGDLQNLPEDLRRSAERQRWPEATIPYDIDPTFSGSDRVIRAISGAIAHWEYFTRVRFVHRRQDPNNTPNYVYFRRSNICASHLGMRGGQQDIQLTDPCSMGDVLHQIGHAVGLWHEHSRLDRDDHIIVRHDYVETGEEHNFDKLVDDADKFGTYDKWSIMHCGPFDFAKDPGKATIIPRDYSDYRFFDVEFGQRTRLTSGDRATVAAIYSREPEDSCALDFRFHKSGVSLSGITIGRAFSVEVADTPVTAKSGAIATILFAFQNVGSRGWKPDPPNPFNQYAAHSLEPIDPKIVLTQRDRPSYQTNLLGGGVGLDEASAGTHRGSFGSVSGGKGDAPREGIRVFVLQFEVPEGPFQGSMQWRMMHKGVGWFGETTRRLHLFVPGPTLKTRVKPYPVPLDQAVDVTVFTTDDTPAANPVAGIVRIKNPSGPAQKLPTNQPFRWKFERRANGFDYRHQFVWLATTATASSEEVFTYKGLKKYLPRKVDLGIKLSPL